MKRYCCQDLRGIFKNKSSWQLMVEKAVRARTVSSIWTLTVTINGFKIFWNILKYVSGGVAAVACSICAGVAENVICRAAQLSRRQPIRSLCFSDGPMRGGRSAVCVSVWYVRNAGGMWAMSGMWRRPRPAHRAGGGGGWHPSLHPMWVSSDTTPTRRYRAQII